MRSFEKFVEFNQSHSFQMLKMLIDFFIREFLHSKNQFDMTCEFSFFQQSSRQISKLLTKLLFFFKYHLNKFFPVQFV